MRRMTLIKVVNQFEQIHDIKKHPPQIQYEKVVGVLFQYIST